MTDPTTSAAFPQLSQPLSLRHVRLRNRITFGAHTANMAEDGLPGERHHHYYLARARGGASLIVTEPVPVHPTTILTRGNFRCDDDSIIAPFRRITDACHAEGSAMIQQLYHLGQHGDGTLSWLPNWSPSGLPSYHDADGSHAMTEPEIQEVIAAFVRAAARSRAAGFDGIELFAGYSCLVDQFWSPWSNRRPDRWGGARENRMRFSDSIIAGIRRSCGEDFVIGLALSFDPQAPILCPADETIAIVSQYDSRGDVDYVSCGTGSYFNTEPLIPSSFQADMFGPPFARELRSALRHIKVQAESQVRTPANAEDTVASGMADLVSLVRAQMADPDLANKALKGHADQIRPCISCNQLCRGRRNRDYWISCLVNPAVGREALWSTIESDGTLPSSQATNAAPATGGRSVVSPATISRPPGVIIVGAGPAGLEAARTAALRGFAVTLLERNTAIGGRYRLAGMQPSRGRILEHIEWYGRELTRLGVELRLGLTVDAKLVAELASIGHGNDRLKQTEIIVAAGGRTPRTGFQKVFPLQNQLPGIDRARVATIEDVLSGLSHPRDRVVVLDELDNWQAVGTALLLQQQGAQVSLVTAAPLIAGGLGGSGADKPLRRNFARAGGRALTSTGIHAISDNSVELVDLLTGNTHHEPVDWLVVSGPAIPEDGLLHELGSAGVSALAIGDCVSGRSAAMAIYEGRATGLAL